MTHNYFIVDKVVRGVDYVHSVLSAIEEEYDHEFNGPGSLLYFVTEKAAKYPVSAPNMLHSLYEVIKYGANELAVKMDLLEEEMEEITDVFSDMFMLEYKILDEILSHRDHFHQKKSKSRINKDGKSKDHRHPRVERNYREFLAKLRTDDKIYNRLNLNG